MKYAKALTSLDGLLTKDQIYTVLYETFDPAKRLHYTVVDDRGVQCMYSESRFELVGAVKIRVGDAFALIDYAKTALVSSHTWYLHSNGYAYTLVGDKTIFMHRLILPQTEMVDHINGNKLDNTAANLRPCTNSQNQMNRHKINSSSGFKGVHWNKEKEKFEARIKKDGVKKFLGYFDSAIEGAKAYNDAANELFGEFARLNTLTPKGSPDFSETSYIRDDVKNTCENITCPVVEEADRRKAMINLKNAMLDGQLKEQLTARREIALQDCDANLAALLYRAKDRITELEAEVQKHNYGPFMVANPEIKTSEDMATKPALVIQHLKKCKNHAICNKPAEAERYEFCYDCWWAQDPRNPAVLKRGAQ